MKQRSSSFHIQKSFIIRILGNKDLTKVDFKVLLYLLTQLDMDTYRYLPQKKVCDELKFERDIVSKSFNTLINSGILEKENFDNSTIGYKFSKGM